MQAFAVRLPSGDRYWTVLDDELCVVPQADGFLRQVRFGRDGSELTTKAVAAAAGTALGRPCIVMAACSHEPRCRHPGDGRAQGADGGAAG